MTKIKHQDHVLEAIDQLRRRKARPDLNRISGYLFRRYSITCKETATAIEELLDAELVIKVDYKGCTSYRNAAKWSMLSYHKSKQEQDFVTTLVCRTVAELILVKPKYLDNGVPYDILEKHVSRKDKRFTKQYFNYVLLNELHNGALVKLSNGNFFVGDVDAPNRPERSLSPETIGAEPSSLLIEAAPSMLKSKPSSPVSTQSTSELTHYPTNSSVLKSTSASFPPKKKGRKRKEAVNTNANDAAPLEFEDFDDSVSLGIGLPDDEMFEPVPSPEPPVAEPVQQTVVGNSVKSVPVKGGKKKKKGRPTFIYSSDFEETEHFGSADNKKVDFVDLNLSGRRKRSKKIVFDPSDNNLPKNKRRKGQNKVSPPGSKTSSPNKYVRKNSVDSVERVKKGESNTSSIFQPVCSICESTEKRVKGSLDSFISCTDCITTVHQSCFEGTKAPGFMIKMDVNNWQCANCKMCSVCEDSADTDKLLIICCACDEAFHPSCHDSISGSGIKVKVAKNNDRWFCSNCFRTVQPVSEQKEEKFKPEPVKYQAPKQEMLSCYSSLNCSRGETDSESVDHQKEQISFESCFNDPFEGHPIDESIPDASKWSSEDVCLYFNKYFQPSIAEIFKKQEIDGLSLLLLKRGDILTGFDLKLGPALKVYGHVKRLQIRRTAPQLLWL